MRINLQFDELEKWCLTACKQENRSTKECISDVCSISGGGSDAAAGFGFMAALAGAGYAIIWSVMADACLQVFKSFKE